MSRYTRNFIQNLRASVENNSEDNINPAPTDPVEPTEDGNLTIPYGSDTEFNEVTVVDDSAAVAADEAAADEAVEVVTALEALRQEIMGYAIRNEYSKAVAASCEARVESELARIAFARVEFPSLEAYSTQRACAEATLESIGEKIKGAATAVWEFIKRIFEWIKNFLFNWGHNAPKLIERLNKAKAAVEATKPNGDMYTAVNDKAGLLARTNTKTVKLLEGTGELNTCWSDVNTYVRTTCNGIFDGRPPMKTPDSLEWLLGEKSAKAEEVTSGRADLITSIDKMVAMLTAVKDDATREGGAAKKIAATEERINKQMSGQMDEKQAAAIKDATSVLKNVVTELVERSNFAVKMCEKLANSVVKQSKAEPEGEPAAA